MTADRYVTETLAGNTVVLDTEYCYGIVRMFYGTLSSRKVAQLAAKRMCDKLNEQERQWEKETSG